MDGVPLIGNAKPGGRNWILNVYKGGNPSSDPQIQFEAASATVMREGAVKFVRLARLKPSTNKALRAHNECRLHIYSHARGDDKKVKYSWNSGAARTGYMVYPDDIKNAEWTMICRVVGVLDPKDSISAKFGGAGHHTSPVTKNQASCFNTHFQYSGSTAHNNVSMEFNHPEYERYSVNPQNNYSNINNRWFGVKVLSTVSAGARNIHSYFNDAPLNLVTGAPSKAGWKPYISFRQTTYKGTAAPHVWGGAKDTWRMDWLTNFDIAYASRVEVLP